MKLRNLPALFAAACLTVLLASAASAETISGDTLPEKPSSQTTAEKELPGDEHIQDNPALYTGQDNSVITMYLTVSRGNTSDGTDHTWAEINQYSAYDYKNMGVDRYKVNGLLQILEDGEETFGAGDDTPNVTVQVRGQSSSRSKQKNYKIRIRKGTEKYRGQRTLNLNKHSSDPVRFTNFLCYRWIQRIPQLIGGRVQFVHLFVRDLTAENPGDFIDYGLYTMVEQVNRTYLKNHLLDENGQLYKVTFFEWEKYDAIMMSDDDPEFDRAAFESMLEIKGNEDHFKLQEAIKSVNDYLKPIQKTVQEYFDAENLCYWMAFNILVSNYDSHARNLFLYSPMNSRKFYIIPWDLDASLRHHYNRMRDYHEGESWENGMQLFLGLKLTSRMLKEKEYRDMLTEAVNDLYQHYLMPDRVNREAAELAKVTEWYLFNPESPDFQNAPLKNKKDFDILIGQYGDEIRENYNYYMESLEMPYPFFVDVPTLDSENHEHILSWGSSFDKDGEVITYSYILARDYQFTDVICRKKDVVAPTDNIPQLEPGRYFLRVTAKNASGYTMDCFDYYSTHVNGKAYGCYVFDVLEDGTAEVFTEAGV